MAAPAMTPSSPTRSPRLSAGAPNALTAGQLPTWLPWALLLVSMGLASAVFTILNFGGGRATSTSRARSSSDSWSSPSRS